MIRDTLEHFTSVRFQFSCLIKKKKKKRKNPEKIKKTKKKFCIKKKKKAGIRKELTNPKSQCVFIIRTLRIRDF